MATSLTIGTYTVGGLDGYTSVVNAANQYNLNQTTSNQLVYDAAVANAAATITANVQGAGAAFAAYAFQANMDNLAQNGKSLSQSDINSAILSMAGDLVTMVGQGMTVFGLEDANLNPIAGGATFTAGQLTEALGFALSAAGLIVDSDTVNTVVNQQLQAADLVANSAGVYDPSSFSQSNFICNADNASTMLDIAGGNNTDQIGGQGSSDTSMPTVTVNPQGVATVIEEGENNAIVVSPGMSGATLNVEAVGGNNAISVSGAVISGSNVPNLDSALGSTFTLEGTGNSADTLDLAGATDVTVLLGDATAEAGFVSSSATVSSLNGGGTVTGSTGDNLNILGVNVTLNANGGQYGLSGSGFTANTSNSTLLLASGSQAAISGSDNAVSLGQNDSATINGGGNVFSANGNASGSTFTLEGTGTNADTLNLAGATDVTALLGNATTMVDLGINNSLTVSSVNGGGTVVGNAGDNVTVSGSNVTVDATAGHYSLTGNGDTADVSNSTISLVSSDQTSVTGSDDTVTTGTSDNVSLIGNGDIATVGTGSTITVSGQSDSITVSGSTIDLASNSQASITGTGDNVTAASGDVIDLSNATITLTADSSVTINGSNDTIIGSSDNSINILGQGDTIDASGGDIYGQTGDTFTVNGSNDLITNGGNSTVSIDGNNDNVAYDGPNSSITVAGTGETLDTSSSDIYGQAGDSFTVNGSGDLITNGGNSTTSLNGNNDTVAYDGPNSSIHVAGTGETLDTSSSDIYGQTGDTFTVNGSGDLVTNGNDSTAWLNGNDDTVAYDGSNSAVVLNGIGETVDLVNNSGTTVNFDANAQGTVEGSGDTVGILGSGDSVIASGDTFDFSSGGDTTKITGNSDTVNAADDSTENISGTGDVVHLISNSDSTVNFGADSDDTVTGSGDTIGIYGPGDTITASNDSIVSGGSGDVATIDGSGDTGSGDDGGGSGDPGDGDPDPGSYGGYYGFAGKQSVINAALGNNINSIAQYDLSSGNQAGAAAAESGLRQAQGMAAATPTSGTGKVVATGNRWTVGEPITWSLASDIGSQYDAEVEQAFASWSAASGITFKETASASPADIQIGFSNLDTSATGVVGYTTVQATGGQISDAVIRLENPKQEALVPGIDGQPTYSGTDATLTQVLLHEIGHALGLADDSDEDSIMYYELTSKNQNLDGTDVVGIQSIYGPSGGTSSTPQPLTAMKTGNGSAEHQLHQLIAGMASFSPHAAGNTSPNHEDLHHHLILAASAN